MPKPKKSSKKREKKNVPVGICHITATLNNTMIAFTDLKGNVLSWSSTGKAGFKGSRKSTPFAARLAAEDAIKKARDQGMYQVDVRVKGPGSGREAALRALGNEGMKVNIIKDITPIPHNGCQAPKMRRI